MREEFCVQFALRWLGTSVGPKYATVVAALTSGSFGWLRDVKEKTVKRIYIYMPLTVISSSLPKSEIACR